MKLGKLRKLISEIPETYDSQEVILQKDGEGNYYSPLAGVDCEDSYYQPENTWSGEVYHSHDAPRDAMPCVLLWPTN